MRNSILDEGILDGNGNINPFHFLIIGMFIYVSGTGVGSALSQFLLDTSIKYDALSEVSLVIKELTYYTVIVLFLIFFSKTIHKKLLNREFNFSRLIIILVLIYFISQAITFSYTLWGYEYFGDLLFKKNDYYKEIQHSKIYYLYLPVIRFFPFIIGPLVFYYYGNKVSKKY